MAQNPRAKLLLCWPHVEHRAQPAAWNTNTKHGMWAANSYLSAGHLTGCQNAPPSWPKHCLLVSSCNMVSHTKSTKTLTGSHFHSGTDSRQIFSLSHPIWINFSSWPQPMPPPKMDPPTVLAQWLEVLKNSTLFWMLANTADPFPGVFLASAEKGHPMGLVNETKDRSTELWTLYSTKACCLSSTHDGFRCRLR